MKSNLIRFLLITFAVLAALVFFEVLLRLFTPVPENLAKLQSSTLFLYENKPNATFSYSSSEFNNQVSINSYGFRDTEFSRDKPPDVFRIAVLGDSQEEALQVSLEDTWQKVMVGKLSADLKKEAAVLCHSEFNSESKKMLKPFNIIQGKQVQHDEGCMPINSIESYNFGVSGYGTDQEWLTLRDKVWQFKPDMVILAFSPNDIGDTYKNKIIKINNNNIEVVPPRDRSGGNLLGKLARETYTYQIVVKAAQRNSFSKRVVDKIRTKILGFPQDERFFISDAQLVQGPFEVIASKFDPPSEVVDTFNVIKALVSDMNRQAVDHGSKFLVTVSIPAAQVIPSEWEKIRKQYSIDDNSSSNHQINDVVGKITSELGVTFYDPRLDAIAWQSEKGDLHYDVDRHFNKNGNLFMGTRVAEFIIKNQLIR